MFYKTYEAPEENDVAYLFETQDECFDSFDDNDI